MVRGTQTNRHLYAGSTAVVIPGTTEKGISRSSIPYLCVDEETHSQSKMVFNDSSINWLINWLEEQVHKFLAAGRLVGFIRCCVGTGLREQGTEPCVRGPCRQPNNERVFTHKCLDLPEPRTYFCGSPRARVSSWCCGRWASLCGQSCVSIRPVPGVKWMRVHQEQIIGKKNL